jgi:hypothetical protein
VPGASSRTPPRWHDRVGAGQANQGGRTRLRSEAIHWAGAPSDQSWRSDQPRTDATLRRNHRPVPRAATPRRARSRA